jgi:hypothetical protein
MDHYYYHDPQSPEIALMRNGIDAGALVPYRELLSSRPPKTELPKWLGCYGEASLAFTLDFGSFRDIQRHRAVTQRMPLLTSEIGFNQWYLSELTPALQSEAEALLLSQRNASAALTTDRPLLQYYLPMGYNISIYLSGDLPALVYLIELRATSLVHPTLATRAAEMAKLLETTYRDTGLVLHLESDPGRFNVKRGEHDIVKRD